MLKLDLDCQRGTNPGIERAVIFRKCHFAFADEKNTTAKVVRIDHQLSTIAKASYLQCRLSFYDLVSIIVGDIVKLLYYCASFVLLVIGLHRSKQLCVLQIYLCMCQFDDFFKLLNQAAYLK